MEEYCLFFRDYRCFFGRFVVPVFSKFLYEVRGPDAIIRIGDAEQVADGIIPLHVLGPGHCKNLLFVHVHEHEESWWRVVADIQ